MTEPHFDTTAESPDADPLREQLLEAAAQVFAEKGYFGTKIMDIVKAAGLSSGAVYGRFASKEDLLMEAVLRQVERNDFASRFHGDTVAEILVSAFGTRGALDDVEAIELEAFIAARREPRVAEAISDARREWNATVVEGLIRRAIAEESASPDADWGSIAYFIETVRLGLVIQRGAGQGAPDEEAWSTFIRRIIRALARPPRTVPKSG